MSGLMGATAGAFFGCLGGLIEWLALRGRSRAFVLVAVKLLIAAGVGAVGASLVALTLHQPYGVWYSLLLTGVLCVLIFPFRLRRYQQRYREVELRRIASMDAA